MGLQITDHRIIDILANSPTLSNQLQAEQLVTRLPGIKQGDLFPLRMKLNPPQQTNWNGLYYCVLQYWRSRASADGNPTKLASILQTNMGLALVADKIRQNIVPNYNPTSTRWMLDTAKLLAAEPELTTDRWEELMRLLGLNTDIPAVRQVGTVNLKEFWYAALQKYRAVNGHNVNLILGLQTALQDMNQMDEFNTIQELVVEENSEMDTYDSGMMQTQSLR